MRWSPLFLALVVACVLVGSRMMSDGVREAGDGVQHHMFARYCWAHPELLLDQWGKPLFTILASPFARFGYNAMAVFNALLAVAATALVLRPMRSAGTWPTWVYPVLVMLAPQYAAMVIDGMTEILFGTMTILSVRLLYEGRYRAGAMAASLTPLCRPEYIVFLPMVMVWLVYRRRVGALAWCGLGIGLYTVFGYFRTGDPLCWFHGNPYAGGPSPYGSGDPWSYLRDAHKAFGWVLEVLFVAALILWRMVERRDGEMREVHRLLLITAATPAVLIVGVHTGLWWTGTHGSAGLTRVLATAVPLAALFALHTLGRGALLVKRPAHIGPVLGCCAVIGSVADLSSYGSLVQTPSDGQRVLHDGCYGIQALRRSTDRVFTTHPYVPFRLGLDAFDGDVVRMLWGFEGSADNVPSRPGDIVFWDSQLGPNESRVELDRFLNDTAFTVIGLWEPVHGYPVWHGNPYEIWVFQRWPAVRKSMRDTIMAGANIQADDRVQLDTMACAMGRGWCSDKEFPWTWAKMPSPSAATLYDEWVVEVEIHYLSEEKRRPVVMVLKREKGDAMLRYDERELREGLNELHFRVPQDTAQVLMGMYMWSPEKQPFRCSMVRVDREQVMQERSVAGLNR